MKITALCKYVYINEINVSRNEERIIFIVSSFRRIQHYEKVT